MLQRQKRGDARTHGISHHVSALDFKMVQQRTNVIGHCGAMICGRIVQFTGLTMSAIVERDHASIGSCQRRDPARLDPVHFFGGRKSVHEHNRVALTLIEIGDFDLAVLEPGHAWFLTACQCDGKWLDSVVYATLSAATQKTQGCAFGRALECGHKPEKSKQRAEKPRACIESQSSKRNCAASGDFQNGARAAAFFLRKLGHARDVSRLPRDPDAIKRSTATGGPFDPADIARKFEQPAGMLGFHSVSRGTHRNCRRSDLTNHAPKVTGKLRTKSSCLAGSFEKTHTSACGRSRAKGRISA